MIDKSTIIIIVYCIYYVIGSGSNGSSGSSEASCLTDLFPCSSGVFGNLFLMVVYAVILGKASSTLADGSELLLEILHPGIIGGVVLPVLGALPDSMIILFSALGTGTKAEIQDQLAVGVGTLAGGTIMLLTIAWSSSILVGRCDLKDGLAVDKTRTKLFTLQTQGVTVDNEVKINAKIMIFTSLTYWIIQGPAFYYVAHPNASQEITTERPFAIAGFIIALANLIGYCVYQVINPTLQKRKMEAARKKAILEKVISFMSQQVEKQEIKEESKKESNDASPSKQDESSNSKADEEELRRKNLSALSFGQKWKQKALEKKKILLHKMKKLMLMKLLMRMMKLVQLQP